MIRFQNVTKRFEKGRLALNDLSFEVLDGETLVLLGRSGCGKSTTLRMINRLIEPTSGKVSVDGIDVMEQDPIALRLKIGMAIQGSCLFPHMTIEENISITCKMLKWDEKETGKRVDELMEMVELEASLKKHYPHELSGGQKQRVGVARALASHPDILLMDEPFGALDPVTREAVQNQFMRILEHTPKTVVFVTHDVIEAVRLGDRIALMDEGEIVQLATPAELVENPANEFVETFLGPGVFQLSMMTQKIGALYQPYAASEILDASLRNTIGVKSTLIEALDLFKRSREQDLTVVQDGRAIGYLRKRDLTEHVVHLLGELSPMEVGV